MSGRGDRVHRFATEVFYEDTDLGGIVYHANYLKFIERGRSTFVRDLGIDQMRMRDELGLVFAVRAMQVEFLRPAGLGDLLEVRTDLSGMTGARLVLDQSVWRGEDCLFTAEVVLVCLATNGRPARLPAELRHCLA